jgi:hypothetical protein
VTFSNRDPGSAQCRYPHLRMEAGLTSRTSPSTCSRQCRPTWQTAQHSSVTCSEFLKAQLTGVTLTTLDVTDSLRGFALLSTSGLGADRAASTLDLSNALFNASFVQKGNAAGTTETVFGGIAASTVGAGTCGLISVVSLVKVA